MCFEPNSWIGTRSEQGFAAQDGVYASDPKTDSNAQRYDSLTYARALTEDLKVMDASAIALARDNAIPIVVFSIHNSGALADVVCGVGRYSTISTEG